MSLGEVQLALHLSLPLLKKDLDGFLVMPYDARQPTNVTDVLSVRDLKPGDMRACIVCGGTKKLKTSRITINDEPFLHLWKSWIKEGFLPDTVNRPRTEPRNALTLCQRHAQDYSEYRFFIRWMPEWQIYVFVNLTSYAPKYHGTIVKLDPQSPSAPLPFLLLAHEARARTHWPLSSIEPITNRPEPSYQLANTPGLCFSVPDTVWCSLHRTQPLSLNTPTPPYTADSMNFCLHLPNLAPHESDSATTITLGSGATAFDSTIKARDVFHGEPCCIVCGLRICGQNTHILPQGEVESWADLKANGIIPKDKVNSVKHDPRNGVRLCPNHQSMYGHYWVFIRYIPEIEKFVLVNHCRDPSFEEIHGIAVYLKSGIKHSPFSSLFLVHELRVRGVWCTRGDRTIPKSPKYHPTFSEGVGGRDSGAGGSRVDGDRDDGDYVEVSLNPTNLQALVTATRRQPAWKAYLVENETWDGTAEENIAKYAAISSAVEAEDFSHAVTLNFSSAKCGYSTLYL